jgi:putative motility protein YjfB-like
MSSIAGAALGQAQTQVSLSTAVLKKTIEAEQQFVAEISEAAQKAPPPGLGDKVDETV